MDNSAIDNLLTIQTVIVASPGKLAVSLAQDSIGAGSSTGIIAPETRELGSGEFDGIKIINSEKKDHITPRYVIAIVHPSGANGIGKENKKILEEALAICTNARRVFVLIPYYDKRLYGHVADFIKERSVNWTTILTGEVIGSKHPGPVGQLVIKSIREKTLPQAATAVSFPVASIPQMAQAVIRHLYSYGFSDTTVLVADSLSFDQIADALRGRLGYVASVGEKLDGRNQPDGVEVEKINSDAEKDLSAFVDSQWKEQYPIIIPKKSPISTARDIKYDSIKIPAIVPKHKNNNLKKKLKLHVPVMAISLLLLWFVVIPITSLALSGLFLVSAYNKINKYDFAKAGGYFSIARRLSGHSNDIFVSLSKLPGAGVVAQKAAAKANTSVRISLLGAKGVGLIDLTLSATDRMLGQDPYDVDSMATQIETELDFLYKELSLLMADSTMDWGILEKHKNDLNKMRVVTGSGKAIAHELPNLIGADKPATYLVLFQNNAELRPTGGFIGSFALVTFEKGRMIDLIVNDVYSADGQLKGHVEPPTAIREHLGEANWFLRDSNWSPDFPQSASNAEWFLDKEMDRQVDGVVAIDLNMVKEILRKTGPVTLRDYNQEISADNLYERVQYEVENDFFPGSRKKANLLTALSTALLEKITTTNVNNMELSKAILESLDRRYLQIYLHNDAASMALRELSWDGSVVNNACRRDNCKELWLGIVEANLGVNKVNYFVKRNAKADIKVDNEVVSTTLTVNIQNSAPASLGNKGNYKNYLRVIAPAEAVPGNYISVLGGSKTLELKPDIEEKRSWKEFGALIEIPPGETRSVVVSWEEPLDLSFTTPGDLVIYWRKQAGIEEMPIQVNISDMPHSLTAGGKFSYNTSLLEDYIKTISW